MNIDARLLALECAVKLAAVEPVADLDTVLHCAERFEAWIMREAAAPVQEPEPEAPVSPRDPTLSKDWGWRP